MRGRVRGVAAAAATIAVAAFLPLPLIDCAGARDRAATTPPLVIELAPPPGQAPAPTAIAAPAGPTRGILLEDLTWVEAEARLRPDTIVVIPLGAASKEHGPHLLLKNDWILAEYFKRRILEAAEVVVAPTIPYHYYPSFVEYPGSTTLRLETARDLVVDVCRSLARFGPRRFYLLNTGVSTMRPLRAAAEALAADRIVMRYTDILSVGGPVEKEVSRQEGGTHADEIETSMLLYIDPASVDMRRAAKDYHPGQGPLTRDPNAPGVYSPTGIYGDATLATPEKGRKIVEAMVEGILKDIERMRRTPLP